MGSWIVNFKVNYRQMASFSLNLCVLVILQSVYCSFAQPLTEKPNSTSDGEIAKGIGALKAQQACDTYPTRRDLQQLADLIFNGVETAEGEFPFIGALGYSENGTYGYYCGASLISDNFLLTASHCTETEDGRAPETVHLGKLSLKIRRKYKRHMQDIKIKRIIKHPDFDPSTSRYNDIAIIELEKPIKRSKYVSPICLSTQLKDVKEQFLNTEGYGETEFSVNSDQKLLRLKLFPVDSKICYTFYKNDPKLKEGIKSDSMICASNAEKIETTGSVCRGDAGGPLQTFVNEKYYLTGISSLGAGFCGCSKIPSIFTRTSFYLDWIASIVWP